LDLNLTGRVALVTGAGRHIGRQIAITLADEGAKVVVNDYFENRAESVAEEIRAAGGQAIGHRADVTRKEEVDAMVERAIGELGGIHILVNNAGIMPVEAVGEPTGIFFQDTESGDWDMTVGVNLYGVMNCSRAVIGPMCNQSYGKIVSMMSDAGRVGEPGTVAYSAAKAGIAGFTKALAKEVGRFCVNVNCISIGATPGPSIDAWLGATPEEREQKIQSLIRLYPMGKGLKRLGLPSDIANAVAFMASDVSQWITGQILSVTGGYSMVD
jgi:NAD(P)-dependent dehydrogenase (short-subunit alcohol dehydrogenase family)